MSVEDRITELERRVARLERIEGVRRTLSLYARALDEHRPELFDEVFDRDCHLKTIPWGADTRGRDKLLRSFERYWAHFQNPRRYYANEAITIEGETAKAFTYWFVTQEEGTESVIGWGTYDWAFRLEGGAWKVTELVIHILAMTTLARGWAIPDKVMMPFARRP